MRARHLAFLCLAGALPAHAEAPLSAIDWLSQSVTTPVVMPAPKPAEPAVSTSPLPGHVAVTPLDGPSADGAGLLTPRQTGLPRNLWGLGRADEIAAKITAAPANSLPALHGLMMTLLLAEADPPADAGTGNALLLARVDKLLSMGALDQAQALLDVAGSDSVEPFRRSFDIALLQGTEDRACKIIDASPHLAPTFPARVFCLARSGDWNAAALTLRTGVALGHIPADEDALLSRFLDPELYEGEPPLPPPERPNPLNWRMFEAIGEPLSTNTLPLAFAHAELRETAGWKAQLEAAERLSRAGVLEPNQLLGLYTERQAAASGGVWDRVAAIHALDAGLDAGDPAPALGAAWRQMVGAELEVPFARIYAEPLLNSELRGEDAALAYRIGLLAGDYADAAKTHAPDDPTEVFLAGIARGKLTGVPTTDSLARAIAAAFMRPVPSPEAQGLLAENRVGEALMLGVDRISRGVQGDLRGVTEGLSILLSLRLDDQAKRVALQLMLLERRG
ncbi:hypothetical protein [Falsirhodobacter xinxiangensis]|uniref:hypothetical protein n=1 Tax=Falsirhodobacter xinxiangensis TaxID=2530049 RepID=UPI0010AA6FFA|nr:hypothetical protein [Rhodobacter xinxiangensis]